MPNQPDAIRVSRPWLPRRISAGIGRPGTGGEQFDAPVTETARRIADVGELASVDYANDGLVRKVANGPGSGGSEVREEPALGNCNKLVARNIGHDGALGAMEGRRVARSLRANATIDMDGARSDTYTEHHAALLPGVGGRRWRRASW